MWFLGEAGKMMVLDAGEVPDQPGNGVRFIRWPIDELLRCEPGEHSIQDLANAAVAIDEDFIDVHRCVNLHAGNGTLFHVRSRASMGTL